MGVDSDDKLARFPKNEGGGRDDKTWRQCFWIAWASLSSSLKTVYAHARYGGRAVCLIRRTQLSLKQPDSLFDKLLCFRMLNISATSYSVIARTADFISIKP